jgi:hypothetical protein
MHLNLTYAQKVARVGLQAEWSALQTALAIERLSALFEWSSKLEHQRVHCKPRSTSIAHLCDWGEFSEDRADMKALKPINSLTGFP